MNTLWRIELLGGLRVVGDDRAITRFQTRKFALLLAYLAYYPQRSHSRAALVELLWPESEPSAGRNSLSQALTSLRRQLEPPGVPGGRVVIADRTSVWLNPAAYLTDVGQFEAALRATAQARSTAERVQHLAEAVELHRGELLAGFLDPWILPERVRLAEAFLAALDQLVVERERAGDLHGALQWARRAVSADPLREEAHREVMRLLAAMGQAEAALRQHRELERLLAAELDAEPEVETRALVRKLAAQARQATARDRPPGDTKRAGGNGRVPEESSLPLAPSREAEPSEPIPVGSGSCPPSGAPAGSTGRLPLAFTRFFGREQEIAQLLELLRCATSSGVPCLVTLTGPGGSGKTRLALEVATRMQESFQGAVWFTPLLELSDPRLIIDQVLDTLRLPRSPGVEPLEQVVAALARRPALLLLDNFEHLVDDGAAWVQALLEQVPTLTCLVTSRRRLDLSGEREFPVPPLPTPDGPGPPDWLLQCESVRLFVDRAQAVRPDFQLTPGNADTVAALCARLEGIPLALELAAARAWVLTPAQMLERLSQRFELLVSRQRDLLPRHRSLRATLDWSYELLSSELQRFFAQLCVFRGGWTLAAAEAVCADGAPADAVETPRHSEAARAGLALAHLEQLREYSLILAEDPGASGAGGGTAERSEGVMRFRMLETLREYAMEQLLPADLTALQQRHAAYHIELAEEAGPKLKGDYQEEWLERLAAEHDNFRAALEWSRESDPAVGLRLAAALWRFWAMRSYLREGREWLATALAHPSAQGRTAARAEALCGAGELARYQDDNAAMCAPLEESVAIWRELGDKRGLAHALSCLGMAAWAPGDVVTARSLLEESVPLFREVEDTWGLALVLTRLGMVALRRRDHAEVRSRAAESLPLWRALGDKWGRARPLCDLGIAAWREGNDAEARSRLEESLRLLREVGDCENRCEVIAHLGHLARRQGDYTTAHALFEESLALQRERGNRDRVAYAQSSLGLVAQAQGDYRAAASLYRESLAIRHELGFRPWIAIVLAEFAGLAVEQGQFGRAARLLGAVQTQLDGVTGFHWQPSAGPLLDRSELRMTPHVTGLHWRPYAGPCDFFHELYFEQGREQMMATVRDALGEAGFAAVWEEGSAMTLEQTVRDASDSVD